MFKSLKYLFYALLILAVLFLYWFLPKYSFIHKNPGYCTNLTSHIYYCGNQAGLDRLFK
jgi:hypothetical protein